MHRPAGYTPAPNRRPEVQVPYYGTAHWKKLRAIVLKRDGYRCTEIGCTTPNRGEGGRLIAGHIIPRPTDAQSRNAPTPADHPLNVRTFCPTCDNRHHADKMGFSRS
jgi:5-methylcytosine-specific restriction endonuclease McrA